MAEIADAVTDVWKKVFGDSPSQKVEASLIRLLAHNPQDEILDAIQITSTRFHITSETDRLKYVSGILKNKRIEKVLPDKAAERYQLNKAVLVLQAHWNKQPRGTHYLDRSVIQEWLTDCSVDEIKAVMDVAEGYWARLREEMKRLIKSRRDPKS
jgi:hypothetical protein